jgi:hypothetical protein
MAQTRGEKTDFTVKQGEDTEQASVKLNHPYHSPEPSNPFACRNIQFRLKYRINPTHTEQTWPKAKNTKLR